MNPLTHSTQQAHDSENDQAATPAPAARRQLYTSDLAYEVGEISQVSLIDTARNNYEIPLITRYPVGAPGPRPVVFWNHGGSPSPRGASRSEEWSRKLAAAGYVLIHPSRTLITDLTPFQAEGRDS